MIGELVERIVGNIIGLYHRHFLVMINEEGKAEEVGYWMLDSISAESISDDALFCRDEYWMLDSISAERTPDDCGEDVGADITVSHLHFSDVPFFLEMRGNYSRDDEDDEDSVLELVGRHPAVIAMTAEIEKRIKEAQEAHDRGENVNWESFKKMIDRLSPPVPNNPYEFIKNVSARGFGRAKALISQYKIEPPKNAG